MPMCIILGPLNWIRPDLIYIEEIVTGAIGNFHLTTF